ncbi:archaea-specific SMC-related protein [Halohasta litorea]|uniref:Archaea-specific SMC-related protein n=1 Tax=Halohasta litorea TaxID=869891 RepID=A0ABD6DEI0_9EURY|nr:archaea-specific SMC-related protein [Halohasta litorea]
MTQLHDDQLTAQVEISNIGGIDHSSLTLHSGVNVLTGKNATNRTSFLKGLMAVCGSEKTSLKADADHGEVTLTMGEDKYTRTITRRNGVVSFDGTPYLDDPVLADLFAFLLEDNEARQAVARGDDLREILMRPVDTVEIEQEIESLQSERDEIDTQLQRLDSLEEQLPKLEADQRQLEDEIEEKKAELAEKTDRIESLDTTVDETREEQNEYESKIDSLRQARQERQRVEKRITSEQESIEGLRTDREELAEEVDSYDSVPDNRISEIEQEVQRLRGQMQQIDSIVSDLQSVIQFNDEFLDEGQTPFLQQLDGTDGSTEGDITDQLVNDSTDVTCWTCGSTVETTQIESTLDELRTIRNDKMDQRKTLQGRVDDLQEEKSSLTRTQQAHERIQRKLADVEAEIDDRTDTLDDLKAQRAELETRIESLESEVEALEDIEQSEILDLQKETSRIEVEIEQLRSDLEAIEAEIDEAESELADRERLERQRDRITDELGALRTRIEDLQIEAVEEFNSHMDALLDRLGYENLERIWIERTETEVREGRRKVTKDQFELHVVRSTDSGTVYEDVVDHLSESERELTGLVFALAGYLVHDVHDHVPFMLLDSIEAIDSDRIARLVDYLDSYSDYLVVALLEEDARALEGSYPRIESI